MLQSGEKSWAAGIKKEKATLEGEDADEAAKDNEIHRKLKGNTSIRVLVFSWKKY